jgi:hypothetical protein
VLALLACGDDAEARPEVGSNDRNADRREVRGGIPSEDAPSECEPYCEHANECAEREGREIPEAGRDCEEACAAGGMYASAPPATFACASAPCGEAFRRCSFDAMMAHMRTAEIGVFPQICEGMCNKLVHCALRLRQPAPEGLDDCRRACAEGGPLAGTTENELRCVNELCGRPFDECLAAARAQQSGRNPAP